LPVFTFRMHCTQPSLFVRKRVSVKSTWSVMVFLLLLPYFKFHLISKLWHCLTRRKYCTTGKFTLWPVNMSMQCSVALSAHQILSSYILVPISCLAQICSKNPLRSLPLYMIHCACPIREFCPECPNKLCNVSSWQICDPDHMWHTLYPFFS